MSNNPDDSMIRPKTFQCPTCGTPLEIGTDPSIKCPSCGNTVLVPAKYRPAQPQPPQQPQIIFQQPVIPAYQMPDVNQMVRNSQRVGLIITVVILVFTFGIVGFSLFAANSASQSITTQIRSSIGGVSSSISGIATAASPNIAKVPTAVPLAGVALEFGGKGSGAGQFDDSRYIATDKDGNIYVGDYGDGRVQKFDASGNFQLLINVPEDKNGNNYMRGMAADLAGNLYVSRGGDILKFSTADGSLVQTIAGHFPDTYYDVLTIDASNTLYALTSSAATQDLVKLDSKGKVLGRFKDVIHSVNKKDPAANMTLAVDGVGNIYIASEEGDQIYIYDKSGKFTNRFGDSGKDAGQLDHPGPIVVDGQQRLYIAMSGRIDRFSSTGRYLDEQSIGYTKGVPMGMAIDLNGNVYIITNLGYVQKYTYSK